jgi:hypothetical protein
VASEKTPKKLKTQSSLFSPFPGFVDDDDDEDDDAEISVAAEQRSRESEQEFEFDPFSFLFLFCLFSFWFFLTRTQVPTICFLSWLRILTPSNEKILPRSHDHAHPHTAANQKTKNSLSQFYIT